MATQKTVAFQTLGCKLNFAETSSLAAQFRSAGYLVVRQEDPADIFVLNTCSVTEFADRKCRKAVRQALRLNPEARIAVTGCYAQLQPEEIAGIEGVDLVLGAGDKFRLLEYVEALDKATEKAWVRTSAIDQVTDFSHAHATGDRTRAFLKIQDGCDYKCAFCTIPKARGRSRSPRIEEILGQVRKLESAGIQEAVLTGVNIGDFGHNGGLQESFIDLIRTLESETDIPRYRISSIEPNLCHAEIIAFVANAQRFMPHFHMPLQSGSPSTLRRMRRRYTRDLYAERVRMIRKRMPHACIGADVIVGFPGETDADFQETFDFLDALQVSYLHVFTYSERPDTVAAEMAEPVPMSLRRTRNERLRKLSRKKRKQFYLNHLGEKREVLLERPVSGQFINGYTDNYIKVVAPETVHPVNALVPLKLEAYAEEQESLVYARD